MESTTRRFGLPGFMNAWLRVVIIAVIASAGMRGRVSAQVEAVPPPSEPAQFSDAELEKLAEPIALYPDPLLAVILPASVYPLEIVQAARFVQDANNIPQLDNQPWDENVIALAQYPTVLQQMNDNLPWTVDLGNAFADQPADLMNAIQTLRARAEAAGSLKSTPNNRPNTQSGGNRPTTRTGQNRPNTMAPINNAPPGNMGRRGNRPGNRAAAGQDNSAFGGVGNGNDARNFSNRGSDSRGGRGGGGGRSGGGRSGGGGGGGRGGGGPRGGGG